MTDAPTIAIVGCGAVTSRYYLPALAGMADRARVIGLHDSDAAQARKIGMSLPDARVVDSFAALLDLGATIVIVASPPAAHAAQAIAALRSGAHVLCEKPMALSWQDADAMTDAARRYERMLAVNMVRRYFPASGIVKTLIRHESLGQLRSISAFEGGPFRWPVRDQTYFSRAVSGGGVLADIGTHVVDLLTFWLGDAEFTGYSDDAMGGVEANARLDLRWKGAPATIRLSRDWPSANAIDLMFESARVRWTVEQLNGVELQWTGESSSVRVENNAAADFRFVDCFTTQLDSMLDHLAGRKTELVTAAEALPTVALIERAYRERALMPMPWLEPLERQGHG